MSKQPTIIRPRERPESGFTAEVNFLRVRDGDTIEFVGIATSLRFAIRLIDCWCYETDDSDESLRTIALEAKREAEALCKLAGSELAITIPFDSDYFRFIRAQGRYLNPFDLSTFDRIPGYVWIDQKTTLNQRLVEMKLASSTKEGELGI
jgi:hypothetical protein